MSLHVIAVARTLVDDNECVEVETMADAERIILSSVGDNDNEMDADFGEPSAITGNETPLSGLIGAPDGWVPPQPPPTFQGDVPKTGAPSEDEIDNPAGWSMYIFTPTYDKKNNYPLDDDGRRQVAGWEFQQDLAS